LSATQSTSHINYRRARSSQGCCSPRSYKSQGRRVRILTFATRIRPPPQAPPWCQPRAPPLRICSCFLCSHRHLAPHPCLPWLLQFGCWTLSHGLGRGDPAIAGGVGEWRAADAGRRQPTPGVDGPIGIGQGAQPPQGYVVSFVRLHERGFNAPASRFMRGLCHHYRVELHNLAPIAIS
jgi:hypothetical protein